MGELPLTVPWYVGWTVARLPIGAARKLWPVLELSTAVAVAVASEIAVAVARGAPVAVGAGAAKEGQVGEEEKEDVRKGRAGSGADGTDGYGFQVSISLGGCSNYWPNSITHS